MSCKYQEQHKFVTIKLNEEADMRDIKNVEM